MPIVTSTFASDLPQPNGRAWIDESHIDHLGAVYGISYLGLFGAAEDKLAEHAALLDVQIVESEIAANIIAVSTLGSVAMVALDYSTSEQNDAAIRDAYFNASEASAVMIGDYLEAQTDERLEVAFDLTEGEVTTLRADKLTPAAAAAATIRATTGA